METIIGLFFVFLAVAFIVVWPWARFHLAAANGAPDLFPPAAPRGVTLERPSGENPMRVVWLRWLYTGVVDVPSFGVLITDTARCPERGAAPMFTVPRRKAGAVQESHAFPYTSVMVPEWAWVCSIDAHGRQSKWAGGLRVDEVLDGKPAPYSRKPFSQPQPSGKTIAIHGTAH